MKFCKKYALKQSDESDNFIFVHIHVTFQFNKIFTFILLGSRIFYLHSLHLLQVEAKFNFVSSEIC